MRKVKVSKWVRKGTIYVKEPSYIGLFHEWGTEPEEFEDVTVGTTVAIVEMPDGTLDNVPSCLLQFIEEGKVEVVDNYYSKALDRVSDAFVDGCSDGLFYRL